MACYSMTRKRREDRSLIQATDGEAFLARAGESGFARTKLSIFVVSNHAYEIFGMLSPCSSQMHRNLDWFIVSGKYER